MPRVLTLLVLAALATSIMLSEPILVRFVDLAATAGLTTPNVSGGTDRKDYILETTGNGAAIFDYDNDGDNDLFLASGTTLQRDPAAPARPSRLYRNDGAARFTDVSAAAGFREEAWAQGACAADYDNDGHTDLLVTHYGHDRLYRNQGDHTFRNVTAAARLPVTGTRYGAGCSFVDYDRDGHLDLFVSNYVDLDLARTPKPGENAHCEWKNLAVMCGPRGLPLARNILYRNNGDGTFADVSERAGILKPGGRYGLGVVAADFNNDQWPDLYVACDMTPSLLYQNRGDGTFVERGVEAGVAYNMDGRLQAGMGVAVADYDGDGLLDIAKTNFSGDLTSLYKNEDGGFFTDVSRDAGLGVHQLLGWGIAFADVDEDGWPDLVVANGHVYPEVQRATVGDRYRQPTLLFRNLGNGRFADLTAQAGPAFQPPRPTRGLAVGDLDGDHRPEIVLVNMNEPPGLLKNQAMPQATGRNFLSVAVVGTRSNRSGIGARITVQAGTRRWLNEVRAGGSFYSQHELALHFGLGSATRVDRLEIRWPSGLVQEWKNVAANRKVTATEGKPELVPGGAGPRPAADALVRPQN